MIIVTGSVAYDYIMEFPGNFGDHILPEHIRNVNLSFITSSYEKRRGGTAGNASYVLNLLGITHKLYSTVGKDFDDYKSQLEQLKLSVEGIKVDNSTYTATGFALTDNSNNQIWGFFYGAAEKNSDLSLKGFAKKKDIVLVGPQGAVGSMHFVDEAIAYDIPYMFDPGFILTQVSVKDLTRGVKNAAYIIGNEYELHVLRDRIKNFDKICKDKVVITTLGEKGSIINTKEKEYIILPVKTTKVVNTTGAGDAWRGGFLAGLDQGFDMQTCGQMGAVASVYAVESMGTQDFFFTKKQFCTRYKTNFGSSLILS